MTEFWRKRRGGTYHVCVDSPQHTVISPEPDIYTMRTLCDRYEFQRDGDRFVPWWQGGKPKRICKSCEKASQERT